ncbi:MAG: ZIP family metal transporter [Myxococcaceae bacterium]|nr:ZIP family metal transporter [Myxococcaceae bacterium]
MISTNMNWHLLAGVFLPFLGTTAGAACVFFLRDQLSPRVQKALLGFASGVMVAASVWSLLVPAMNLSAPMGRFAFVPAAIGFLLGIGFLLALDHFIPHLHLDADTPEGTPSRLSRSTMLMLAVTLHNIPEGMAVGAVLAGLLAENGGVTLAGALSLSLGIAIQNFPEGAVISLPLKSEGRLSRSRAFGMGTLSGVAEPVAALLTLLAASLVVPLLPYCLAFAAGAMIYVVVEELIPESAAGEHSNAGTIGFALGFVLMMILDVALG